MLVAPWSGSLLAWEDKLSAFKLRLNQAFGRAELRRSAGAFIDGVLSSVARKTGWQLAEQAGLERPYRLQSVLGRSAWQADRLRDLVRSDALATLGDAGGVLVVDETGFLKKGTHSVGVARQYSGTAGRVENCQVGVFVAYASRFGQALIDRRLYLPEVWANDAARRRVAAVPETVAFQTKPVIAAEMIAAALDVFGAIAHFERRPIAERTKGGIAAARAKGKRPGRKPLDADRIAAALKLVAAGLSPTDAAKQIGLGRSTVYREVATRVACRPVR